MERKQIVVIGAGQFGASIAVTAEEIGHQVLLIDRNKERIDMFADYVTHAVVGDVSSENVLPELGISNFDVAVISLVSNFQASILSALVCKEMGIPMIIAKARDDVHARVLQRIGANKVVFPERDSGIRLAHSLTHRNIIDFITLSDSYDMMEIIPLRRWIGQKIRETDIAREFGLNVIAVKEGQEILLNPGPDYRIQTFSVLTVLGHKDGIRRLEQEEE